MNTKENNNLINDLEYFFQETNYIDIEPNQYTVYNNNTVNGNNTTEKE
jgi:hypothetical protein